MGNIFHNLVDDGKGCATLHCLDKRLTGSWGVKQCITPHLDGRSCLKQMMWLLFLKVFNLICKSADAFCFLFTFYFTLYTLHLPSHFLFFWLIQSLSYQVAGQWKSSVKKLPLSWKKMCFVIILILTLRSLSWYKTSSALSNLGDVTVGQSQQLILFQLLHLQNDGKDMHLCQVLGEERTAL